MVFRRRSARRPAVRSSGGRKWGERVSVVSKLFIAIIVLALPFTVSSELPPKTPEVPPQQKSDSPVEPQKQTTSEEQSPHQSVAPIPPPHSAIPSGESKNNGDKGGDEGSEFWPSFNRYRIKVTDSHLCKKFRADASSRSESCWCYKCRRFPADDTSSRLCFPRRPICRRHTPRAGA